jgi:predicted DsbA family dithiol-disulfide isomerase
MSTTEIVYFSDVLCVWAYVGQIRVETLRERFGSRVQVTDRFINVYGDVEARIRDKAGDQAGDPREAYATKMRGVAERFEHTSMHPDVFTRVVPRSSNQAHLVLAGVRALIREGRLDDATDASTHGGAYRVFRLARRVRRAFFEEARDVGDLGVVYELLEEEGVPRAPVEDALRDGRAMAELSQDFLQKDRNGVTGSPTYVLDGGRQKLFGNVGYKIIDANVTELLDAGRPDRGASWC